MHCESAGWSSWPRYRQVFRGDSSLELREVGGRPEAEDGKLFTFHGKTGEPKLDTLVYMATRKTYFPIEALRSLQSQLFI